MNMKQIVRLCVLALFYSGAVSAGEEKNPLLQHEPESVCLTRMMDRLLVSQLKPCVLHSAWFSDMDTVQLRGRCAMEMSDRVVSALDAAGLEICDKCRVDFSWLVERLTSIKAETKELALLKYETGLLAWLEYKTRKFELNCRINILTRDQGFWPEIPCDC